MKNLKKISLLGTAAPFSAAIFSAIAVIAASKTVQAAPTLITTAQGRGADLNVRGGGFAKDNFADHEILRVRNTRNLGDARKTYLRFDLSSLGAPAKKATGVALGLAVGKAEGQSPEAKIWTFNVSALRDAIPEENWDERKVTWNNAPASDPASPLELTPDALPLGTFTLVGKGTAGQQIAFSSPQLLKLVQGDTNGLITLIITRQEAGNEAENDVLHIFTSKENKVPAPPVLSVAFGGETPELPKGKELTALPIADKPLPFENEIEAFEAADKINPPKKGGILFTGSSSIRLWNSLQTDFPGYGALNRGFGGSKISDSVNFVDRIVTPYEPRMIVFYAGTNDLADGKTPETLLADYLAFVSRVRAKLPATTIAFISVAPAPSRFSRVADMKRVNAMIADLSRLVPNMKFIDIFPLMLDAEGQPRPELYVGDQLHMNEKGYAIWKKAVESYLSKP